MEIKTFVKDSLFCALKSKSSAGRYLRKQKTIFQSFCVFRNQIVIFLNRFWTFLQNHEKIEHKKREPFKK